jgi:hypothetical protein
MSDRDVAHIGLRKTSMPLSLRNSRFRTTRLRGFHAAAQSHTICVGPSPLTGLGSPSGYYLCCTVVGMSLQTLWSASQPHDSKLHHLLPSEVSSPSAFLSCTELPSPDRIHPVGSVAPSGFRTLSTLSSPCNLAGLFHPATALGVSLRGLVPHAAPYVLSDAGSLVVARTAFDRDTKLHIRGSMHAVCSPPVALGFSQVTTSVPPWVSLFEVSYRRQPTEIPRTGSIIPLSFFTAAAFKLATAAEPQGVGLSQVRLFSLENDHPP